MVASNFWHEPPNSTAEVRKFNHRAGRYAVWGQHRGGREVWEVVDGQGPRGKPLGKEFDSPQHAMEEAERIISDNEHSQRGTGVGKVGKSV